MNDQIRTEIKQIVEQLPESKLESVLSYLQQLETNKKAQLADARLLEKIFEEDAGLLKKLA